MNRARSTLSALTAILADEFAINAIIPFAKFNAHGEGSSFDRVEYIPCIGTFRHCRVNALRSGIAGSDAKVEAFSQERLPRQTPDDTRGYAERERARN